MADDGFDPDTCAVRHLSCRERTALKERVTTRANEERRRLLRRGAAKTIQALHLTWRHVSRPFVAAAHYLIARQMQLSALRQLAAMDDRELRDIGISRLEIGAAAQSRAPWPRGDRNASGIQPTQGEKHVKGLLDRPRLCS
jgi:uncharacterized protein YjiS (DUF1127 family)